MLGQLMRGISDARVVMSVDPGDAQSGELFAIERVDAAGFHAILHVQIAIAAQCLQRLLHHTFAALFGRLGAQPESAGSDERCDREALHGFLARASGVNPELIL